MANPTDLSTYLRLAVPEALCQPIEGQPTQRLGAYIYVRIPWDEGDGSEVGYSNHVLGYLDSGVPHLTRQILAYDGDRAVVKTMRGRVYHLSHAEDDLGALSLELVGHLHYCLREFGVLPTPPARTVGSRPPPTLEG